VHKEAARSGDLVGVLADPRLIERIIGVEQRSPGGWPCVNGATPMCTARALAALAAKPAARLLRGDACAAAVGAPLATGEQDERVHVSLVSHLQKGAWDVVEVMSPRFAGVQFAFEAHDCLSISALAESQQK